LAQNETILDRVQAGFETTPGTAVPAMRKLYSRVAPSIDAPLSWFNDQTGTYANRRRASKGRTSVSMSATDLMTFEDLHWWLYMFVEGTPDTAQGGGATPNGVYTHDFIPDLATDTLKSATFEWGDPGNKYTTSQVYANSFTLRGDADSDSELGWMIEADLIGRTFDPLATFTALPDRTTEVVMARGTQCFIDPTPATIGTTEVETLINWSISGNINRHTKAFSRDKQYVAQGRTGRRERTFDVQFTMEFEDDLEFANYRNEVPVQRAVRLAQQGSDISTDLPKELQIDVLGYWSAVSFGDREGNKTITYSLNAGYDAIEAFDATFKIVNEQAAITA
jgi:hypothetical protein